MMLCGHFCAKPHHTCPLRSSCSDSELRVEDCPHDWGWSRNKYKAFLWLCLSTQGDCHRCCAHFCAVVQPTFSTYLRFQTTRSVYTSFKRRHGGHTRGRSTTQLGTQTGHWSLLGLCPLQTRFQSVCVSFCLSVLWPGQWGDCKG